MPTKTDWRTGWTPFFTIGASGGTQNDLYFKIGYAAGALNLTSGTPPTDATVFRITGAGVSTSTFDVNAQYVNGVIEIDNITNVASDNVFTGNLWSGCAQPASAPTNKQACGNYGVYSVPGSSAGGAQGNIIRTGWIQNFNMGGVIENDATFFTGYFGGLEQNGTWTTQVCMTGISGTFQIGEMVTEGSTSGVVETPTYAWRNNQLCMQVIETNVTMWYSGISHTNFINSGTLTGSTSGATGTISATLVVDQLYGVSPYDPESFDIVSAHTDTQMDDIATPVYLGGVVGPLLATSDIAGKNGSTFNTCFRGVGLHTTGGAVELQNCSVNLSTSVAVFGSGGIKVGGYDSASPSAQTISVPNVAAGNGNAASPVTTIQGSLSNGAGCGGDIDFATTNGAASSGTQNSATTGLVIKACTHAVQSVGTNTNDNAPSGYVGEYISSNVARGSGTTLTTAVTSNITSISLTPGDWDVSGLVAYSGVALAQFQGAVSTVSASIPVAGPPGQGLVLLTGAQSGEFGATVMGRITLTTTTAVYLVLNAVFSGGSAQGYGFIGARRAR